MSVGDRLKAAREAAGMQQVEVALALEVHPVTVSKWERDVQRPNADAMDRLSQLYRVPARDLLRGEGDLVSEIGEHTYSVGGKPPPEDGWTPNASLVGQLPRRVYDVAIAYCRRLAAAGLPKEEIEEAERLLIDEGYAKINKRAKRILTEDEQIQIIDATWGIMQEVLSWKGVRA